jgi:hypothetical protein
MANKKEKYDVQSIQGISIYHEDKRTVYSPFFQQKGYILSENNVHAYVSYIQGYLVALVVFVVAFIIYRRFLIPFILALLFMISTIVSFYLNFIRKANVIENYKKPERDSFISRQAKLDRKNLLTIAISSPLLSIALMLHAYLNQFAGEMFYMMLLIAIVALLYGLLHIYILYYKKINEK